MHHLKMHLLSSLFSLFLSLSPPHLQVLGSFRDCSPDGCGVSAGGETLK